MMVIIFICSLTVNVHKFKANNKNINFPTKFCLGSISEKFGSIEFREVSLKRNIYAFSVDYSAIDKYDLLNIHKYLLVENNTK